MKLLEYYIKNNENKKWYDKHVSSGKGMSGKMFEYTNTNYRSQDAFCTHFLKFQEIENTPRIAWPRQEHHGQEIHKHEVINMIQSKLFKRKAEENAYGRTSKGILYGDFIKNNFEKEEKWLINYLFLLDGYYANRKNYIVSRVKNDLLDSLLSVEGITEDSLIRDAKELLTNDSFEKILRCTFFYIHSFYDDPDFLTSYFRATPLEREELAGYIEENYQTREFGCCISKKYEPSGIFNKNSLLDETKVFLITLLFVSSKGVNLSNISVTFVTSFMNTIGSLNDEAVLHYLEENKEIFDPIFFEVLELEETEIIDSEDIDNGEIPIVEDRPEEYIDDTSEEGKSIVKEVYYRKKRQARKLSGYKCALEKINNCNPIYFTAKLNNQNYLELHHLIPKEFRNNFAYSIEVLANYVTLCPRCHRQIHLAVDKERRHLINALYADREVRLSRVGLQLELSELYEYYKIDL